MDDDLDSYLADARKALDELTDAQEGGAAKVDGSVYDCLFALFQLCKQQGAVIERLQEALATAPPTRSEGVRGTRP